MVVRISLGMLFPVSELFTIATIFYKDFLKITLSWEIKSIVVTSIAFGQQLRGIDLCLCLLHRMFSLQVAALLGRESMDGLIVDYPGFLDAEVVEEVLDHLAALMPTVNVKHHLQQNPDLLLSAAKGKKRLGDNLDPGDTYLTDWSLQNKLFQNHPFFPAFCTGVQGASSCFILSYRMLDQ